VKSKHQTNKQGGRERDKDIIKTRKEKKTMATVWECKDRHIGDNIFD